MGNLKKAKALIWGLAVLFVIGCNKEEENIPKEEDWSQYKCLVAELGGHPFIYDAAGKLIKIRHIPPTWEPWDTSHQEMTYNAFGNIKDKKFFNGKGEVVEQNIYTYNSNNLPDTLFLVKKGIKSAYKKYEYNAAGKLSKISYFETGDPDATSYSDITYPASDQSMEQNYYRLSTGWFTGPTTVNHYDNKNHPFSQLGFYGVGWYSEDFLISKHNIVSSVKNGTKKEWHYTYNAQGYPTYQSLIEPRTSSFPSPYGSLGGLGGGEGYSVSYNCQ